MNTIQKSISLRELNNNISACRACSLRHNGQALPDWTKGSRYVILAEAPGSTEVETGYPLVGTAGQILWDAMREFDLYRYMFGIINAVQCRPVDDEHNVKPTLDQIERCSRFRNEFITIMEPEKMLIMGNYGKYCYDRRLGGIVKENGSQWEWVFSTDYGQNELRIPVIMSVHPAYIIYNPGQGKALLREAIKTFTEAK